MISTSFKLQKSCNIVCFLFVNMKLLYIGLYVHICNQEKKNLCVFDIPQNFPKRLCCLFFKNYDSLKYYYNMHTMMSGSIYVWTNFWSLIIKYFKTHSLYMYTSISYYIFFVNSISRKFVSHKNIKIIFKIYELFHICPCTHHVLNI